MADDDLIDALLGLRRVPSPEEVPASTLINWRIFKANGASNHFVGLGTNGLMRISSDVVNFDATALTGVTQSGRFYRLEGPPADDEDTVRAEVAFARWAMSYGVDNIRDVTDEFLADPKHQRGIVQ